MKNSINSVFVGLCIFFAPALTASGGPGNHPLRSQVDALNAELAAWELKFSNHACDVQACIAKDEKRSADLVVKNDALKAELAAIKLKNDKLKQDSQKQD